MSEVLSQQDGDETSRSREVTTDPPNEEENLAEVTEVTEAQEEQEEVDTPRSGSESARKDWATAELGRIEKDLENEKEKIILVEPKEYSPYVFNNLGPYCNTETPRFVILKNATDALANGYATRLTATGLTDPWVDHDMDVNIPEKQELRLPPLDDEKKPRVKKGDFEGSTRLPKFPVVQMDNGDLLSKDLTVADVKSIRDDLRTKYQSGADKKQAADYKRTKDDFFRMELDKLDEVKKINQKPLRQAYFAYLQNTPGSKKALRDCMKEYDEKQNKTEEGGEEENAEEVETAADSAPGPGTYEVTVVTSSKFGSGTDAKVYLILNEIRHELSTGKFEAGDEDKFSLQVDELVTPLSNVTIGHDNAGLAAGWHLDKVTVFAHPAGRSKGILQTFACDNWLDDNEGDKLVERVLPETARVDAGGAPEEEKPAESAKQPAKAAPAKTKQAAPAKQAASTKTAANTKQTTTKKSTTKQAAAAKPKEEPAGNGPGTYEVRVTTSDQLGSGTDANVYIILNNIRHELATGKFESGDTDEFSLAVDDLVSPLPNVTIGHSNSGFGSGWHLNKVTILSHPSGQPKGILQTFACDNWLDDNEGDKKVERVLEESERVEAGGAPEE